MRAVCAWCGTTISEGKAGDTRVSHGICPQCLRRYFATAVRYAVVPHDRSFLLSEIESAFRPVGGIRVILDRRRGERRRGRTRVRDDRRAPRRDRRQSPYLIVGALPVVAGVWLRGGLSMTPAGLGDSLKPPERSGPRRHLLRL